MSQGQSLPTSTILLIEADPSLRRLIMLGLSHSGIRVIEACSLQELPALDAQTLDLLLVDVDQGVKSDWSLLSRLHTQAYIDALPIVALSWESPAEDKVALSPSPFSSPPLLSSYPTAGQAQGAVPAGSLYPTAGQAQGAVPTGSLYPITAQTPTGSSRRDSALRLSGGDITCLAKPFDARTLHSTITRLLAERTAQKAAQTAIVEAQVLASYEQHAAPSIWPIVTAAGLLLVVTGLLLQFLLVIVGVVLMLTALLLWTLGTKPGSSSTYVPVSV